MALIPVSCFTCLTRVGGKWTPYVKLLRENKSPDEALDLLSLKAPCCRRMLLTHTDTLERLLRYQMMETDNMKASMQATVGGMDEADDSGGDDG